MPNLLKAAMIDNICSLHQRGWSKRRIARELGIDRETVARHLRQVQAGAKPAIAPSGSAATDDDSKPAIAPSGSAATDDGSKPAIAPSGSIIPLGLNAEAVVDASQRSGRPSECEPWRPVIQDKIDLGLTAQRIYQDLVSEHSFAGSYNSVRRFVRQFEAKQELPFRRLECGPGEEVQVDFGQGAFTRDGNGPRRTKGTGGAQRGQARLLNVSIVALINVPVPFFISVTRTQRNN
jgi:hypothetical protein